VAFSEAIVAMVNQTAFNDDMVTSNISDNNTYQCPRDPQLQRGKGEFIWNRKQQGTVMTAFYYGTILTPVRIHSAMFGFLGNFKLCHC